MKIDILTLFPEMFSGPFEYSMIKRARDRNCVELRIINIRDFATDKHRTVDGPPCGGGPGMVMRPDILAKAVRSVQTPEARVLLMTPQGSPFTQARARELSEQQSHLIILCGHYEGFDERIRQALIDEEISIGDYVLTNGGIAAVVVTDAIVRLLPGVLGDADSAAQDSFGIDNRLDFPQYTKPAEFEGMMVPDVLLSGNHKKITEWRRQQAEERTRARRPDLLAD
ncbi:MAG: tRNA (guanosine(37)-N1)-methyltransferase TrmD [Lentisphaeria bacterium]